MNNLASKLRNSVSKAAIAASRVNKKRADADPDTVASRLTKESRGRIGKRDAVDVEKLGEKLAQMRKVDTKTIRAVEARLSPVEAGQLARVRDTGPTAASAAVRPVTKANTPPSAASLKMVTSVEAGELARRGGDVAAYAAAKQNMTPVQKGEYARLLEAETNGVRSLTRRTVNPTLTPAITPTLNPALTPPNVSTAITAPSLAAATSNPLAQPAFGTKGSIADLNARLLTPVDDMATDGVQPFVINGEGAGANGELRPEPRGFFSDVGDAFKQVGDAFKEVGNTIAEGAEGIVDVFNGGGSGGDNGPEQSLGEFITTLPQVAFDALGSASNFLSVSPIWVAKDLVEGFDQFIVGPVADAANAARDRIVGAYEDTVGLLKDLVSGDAAKNFLAYAGTGTEWGEHMVNLLTDPSGATGFAEGFARGVGESVLDMATQVGKLAQLVGDASFFGRAGDAIREWAGEDNLPPWLNEAIPSEERGEETIQATYDSLVNLGNYISSRAKDPRLLLDDFKNYFGDKWESLKGEWEAAHAAGPRAEGEFFGKIAGKALFEIALNFVPGKALLTVAETALDVSNATKKFNDMPAANKAKAVPELEASLDAQIEAADRVTESGYATPEELASLENTYNEVINIDTSGLTSPDQIKAVEDKKLEAQAALYDAMQTGYSLATPSPQGQNPATSLPKTRDVGQFKGSIDLSYTGARILDHNNHAHRVGVRLIPHQTKYKTEQPITLDDIRLLTRATQNEYALFRREVTDPNGGPPKVENVLIRGNKDGVKLDSHIEYLKDNGFELVAHTHIYDYTRPLKSSTEDAEFLKAIGQDESLIIDTRGRMLKFDKDGNESLYAKVTDPQEFKEKTSGKLNPNATYTYSGQNHLGNTFTHTYKTDSNGRVIEASGNLVGKGDKNRSTGGTGTKVGKEYGRKPHPNTPNHPDNDVGFHLIGDQFLGADAKINFVAGNGALNGGKYLQLETKLRKAADDGKKVTLKVQLEYDDNASTAKERMRPTKFIVTYTIDGRSYTETFENKNPDDKKRKRPSSAS